MRMAESVMEEESMIASWKATEKRPGGRYGGAGRAMIVSLGLRDDRKRKKERRMVKREREKTVTGHGHNEK